MGTKQLKTKQNYLNCKCEMGQKICLISFINSGQPTLEFSFFYKQTFKSFSKEFTQPQNQQVEVGQIHLSDCRVLTQGDLLSGVGGQQEDEECEGGDEDAGNEEVEAVVERPPPHHHGEGHVRVRLLTAVVEALVPPSRNLCKQQQQQQQSHVNTRRFVSALGIFMVK